MKIIYKNNGKVLQEYIVTNNHYFVEPTEWHYLYTKSTAIVNDDEIIIDLKDKETTE